MNTIDSIINYFTTIDYQSFRENAKIIFLVLIFIFLCLALYSYLQAHLIVKRHREHEIHQQAMHEAEHGAGHVSAHAEGHAAPQALSGWEEIQKRANSVREADWKLAVIEADKFVDNMLKAKDFPGETMGERLMLIKPSDLSSLQDLWDAHKLRNLLVHDSTYQLRHEQALAAMNSFERVLKELGVLA